MAGGQGTRLGHNGPKGTFKLDVYGKGKYLFEILVDNLKEANQKYGITINWYIMTSKENNSATVEFLEKNNYFGYDKNFVKIFTQSEMPLIDTEGKLLMGKDYKIREASDGNGGTYSSLRRSGCLADMKEKGIKWVFIGSVDNALLKMVDVTLLGMAIDQGVQIASKSVVKANPHERVGVFCKMNGHPKVIEYSELPEKMAEEIDENGELRYGESHIMCNLFTIEAIEKISKEPLIYHSAFKKNSYIDENGKLITHNYDGDGDGTELRNLIDNLAGTKEHFGSFQTLSNIIVEAVNPGIPVLIKEAVQTNYDNTKNQSQSIGSLFDQSTTSKWFADNDRFSGAGSLPCGYQVGIYPCSQGCFL